MAQADLPGDRQIAATPVGAEAAGGYILAGLAIFGGVGVWLDRLLGLTVLTPVGLVLGAIAGGCLVYLRVVRVSDTQQAPIRNDSGSTMTEGDSRC